MHIKIGTSGLTGTESPSSTRTNPGPETIDPTTSNTRTPDSTSPNLPTSSTAATPDSTILDPTTSEPLPSTQLSSHPPTVDVLFMNAWLLSHFRWCRKPWLGTAEQMVSEIGRALDKGVYRLVSLNASEATVVAVIELEGTREDFKAVHPKNTPTFFAGGGDGADY